MVWHLGLGQRRARLMVNDAAGKGPTRGRVRHRGQVAGKASLEHKHAPSPSKHALPHRERTLGTLSFVQHNQRPLGRAALQLKRQRARGKVATQRRRNEPAAARRPAHVAQQRRLAAAHELLKLLDANAGALHFLSG